MRRFTTEAQRKMRKRRRKKVAKKKKNPLLFLCALCASVVNLLLEFLQFINRRSIGRIPCGSNVPEQRSAKASQVSSMSS